MSLGDLLKGMHAESDGTQLIVRLPVVQLLLIFLAAGMILAGVWLTTRDLGHSVRSLDETVVTLDQTIRGLAVAVDEELEDHEGRIIRLEERTARPRP